MKFAPFVYEYIASDNWDFLEDVSGFESLKEFFGFEVPFTIEDFYNVDYDKIQEYLENWVEEHQLKVISSELMYYDLEKAYEKFEVVFYFEGKYYKTEHYDGEYVTHFKYGYPDCPEVFPYTETITITKYTTKS